MEIKVTYNHGANEFVLHHVTTVDTLYQEVGMLLVSRNEFYLFHGSVCYSIW